MSRWKVLKNCIMKKHLFLLKIFSLFILSINNVVAQFPFCTGSVSYNNGTSPPNGPFIVDDFSSNASWSFESSVGMSCYSGTGTMQVLNGVMNYGQGLNGIYCGNPNRAYRLNSTYNGGINKLGPSYYGRKFRAQCSFNISNGEAYCPSLIVMGFTSLDIDPIRSYGCPQPPINNNTSLMVILGNYPDGPSGNCIAYNGSSFWRLFIAKTKNGVLTSSANYIPIPAVNTELYLRMIRSGNDVCISLYNNSDYSDANLIGYACEKGFLNPAEFPGFNYFQMGGNSAGSGVRRATMTVDNFRVYSIGEGGFSFIADCNSSAKFANNEQSNVNSSTQSLNINLFPNPSNGHFSLSFNSEIGTVKRIEIFEPSGKRIKSINSILIEDNKIEIDASDLPNGFYLIDVIGENQRIKSKVSIQK